MARTTTRFAGPVERYRRGAYRDRILHDLILDDAARLGEGLTFLDIGCGRGFDTDVPLQASLARTAGRYVGVEPDPGVQTGPYFHAVHRTLFEDAPLAPGSVHVAFAVMVLEHLREPQRFWDKLHAVLTPGGVFWGLTVDGRHWFCRASRWTERLRVKDAYLDWMMGRRGGRYENYRTYYRCNTPERVAYYARRFRAVECVNFARVGQLDPVLPGVLRPLYRRVEEVGVRRGRPGTLLAVRAEK